MATNRINIRRTVAPRYAGRPPGGNQVAALGASMRAALSETLKNVMLTGGDAVEAACPIRTGHLLSNFIFSVGTPFTGVAGSPESVSYAEQDAGREAVLNYDVQRDGRIYYRNNVDYLKFQRPFVTEALMSGASAAPRSQHIKTRSMLRSMARVSFKKGA